MELNDKVEIIGKPDDCGNPGCGCHIGVIGRVIEIDYNGNKGKIGVRFNGSSFCTGFNEKHMKVIGKFLMKNIIKEGKVAHELLEE